jgi:excisionase family DNA binding protein
MSTTPAPELLTVTQAADYLSLGRKSIETMIKTGELLAINVSTRRNGQRKAWRLQRTDLDNWLRGRKQKPLLKSAAA